jgi:ubiquinone/menaquinone biosynthesis C-methylase UbiE
VNKKFFLFPPGWSADVTDNRHIMQSIGHDQRIRILIGAIVIAIVLIVVRRSSSTDETGWLDVWERKAQLAGKLHEINGFTQLDANQWSQMICTIAKPILPKLQANPVPRILDVGSGVGAFMDALLKCNPGQAMPELVGSDFSSGLLVHARKRFPNSKFYQANMMDLRIFQSNSFDILTSFSTLFYLPNEDGVRSALREFFRVVKPGGMIFIGDISDADKKQLAENSRKSSEYYQKQQKKLGPDTLKHLYISKALLREIAAPFASTIEFFDEDKMIPFYEPSLYRFTAIFTKKL